MTTGDKERRVLAFINACPIRRAAYAKHGELYFEAVRWVAWEAKR